MKDEDPKARAGRSCRFYFWAVVLACFVVHTANFRELGLADTYPATLLPAAILRGEGFTFDGFAKVFDEPAPGGFVTLWKQLQWTHVITLVNGRLRSSYPIGASLLALPVYALPTALGLLRHFDDYRIAGKVAASLLVAFSSGFVFLSLLRFTERRSALALTAVYAFGTTTWVVASQSLWQHGPALFCLSLAVWEALRVEERGDRWDAALASFAAAFAVVCRPQDALGALAIGLFALYRRPRLWPFLVVPAAVVSSGLVLYNVSVFGSLMGGYGAIYTSPAHAWRHLDVHSVFTYPLVAGLAGLLVSPSRGLFVYSPVCIAGFAALFIAAASRQFPLARAFVVWVVGTLYVLSKNQIWWGGTSFGPRYLTELALPLVLSLGMLWPRIARHAALRRSIWAAALFGIAVEAVGAFTWECGWHLFPAWLDYRPDRLWDYRDPEIVRCAKLLAEKGPRRPEFGPFAR
ncbi:MAG TPA: hypothetical protein VH062_15300 [Polyangiaceae bacterium]|jgi:hypothetical protein|nr:hypothetical protein [Polyangiaceae bacterium]